MQEFGNNDLPVIEGDKDFDIITYTLQENHMMMD